MGVPYATSVSGANHAMNRHNSFTMLDPASGIPSDESFYSFSKTPRIASLTSRHSFEKLPSFGGSTNMASTLAALTGGPPNTNFSATLPSAAPSKRSELYSYAPLPSIPSMNPTSCTNVNTINSQFLSTVKFHAPSSVQTSYANEKRCHCFGMPKICNKVIFGTYFQSKGGEFSGNFSYLNFMFIILSISSAGHADLKKQQEQGLLAFDLPRSC